MSGGAAAFGLAVLTAVATLGPAHAASTDVVFKGGLAVTGATGCTTGWNPTRQFFVGTYWVPVPGSSNGRGSTLTMHARDSSEGFHLADGAFTSSYKPVKAMHIYTLTGSYDAFIKVTRQIPQDITRSTKAVSVEGAIKGWDWDKDCIITFEMNLVRDLQP